MREDVLVRKLVADGHGTTEEKRFQYILKFLGSLIKEPSPSEAMRALRQLDSMELFMKKHTYVRMRYEDQDEEHKSIASTIEKQIVESKEKMEKAKVELGAARIVRKNKQDYSQVVKEIDDMPSRAESIRKLEEIQEELAQQHERQRQLELKLAERRNHLHAFNIILANFEQLVAADDDNDEEMENEANGNGSAAASMND